MGRYQQSMRNVFHKMKSSEGMSLIATSLFMTVLGLLIASALNIYLKDQRIRQVLDNDQKIARIELEMASFKAANIDGRLPCPAAPGLALDDVNFGREISNDCTAAAAVDGSVKTAGIDGRGVHIGTVPVRSLNLPDEYMFDSWGNRFVYAVTEGFASPGAAAIPEADGDIGLLDPNNNSVPSSPDSIVYLLMSHGADNRGAFNIEGQQSALPPAGTLAVNNVDGDARFVTTIFKTDFIGDDTFTAQFGSTSGMQADGFNGGGNLTIIVPDMTQYRWETGPWSVCDDTCSAGQQTRTVECRTFAGALARDTQCFGTKPAETRGCAQACWAVSPWGSCNSFNGVCGNGERTRSVRCTDGNGGPLLPAADCSYRAAPINTQACANPDCYWDTRLSPTSCPTSCGTASQARVVECKVPPAGTVTADGNCNPATKPSTSSLSCSVTSGCSYNWVPSTSACSATLCGTSGTTTTTYSCRNTTLGTSASPASCGGVTPPSTTNPCNAPACACVPSWGPSPSSECFGVNFTQNDGCGNTRSATGSSITGVCAPTCTATGWAPPTSSECSGVNFTQSRTMGDCTTQTQAATGTSITGACAPTVNGSCAAARNTCSSGTANDGAYADTTTDYRWRCDGSGPAHSDSGVCSAPIPLVPVNGVCGTADGTTRATAPSGGALCSTGRAGAVSGSGPWNWSCNGLNGGGNVNCSASVSCTPSWGPATSTECRGDSFMQSDGCGNTRNATGTANCAWTEVSGGEVGNNSGCSWFGDSCSEKGSHRLCCGRYGSPTSRSLRAGCRDNSGPPYMVIDPIPAFCKIR